LIRTGLANGVSEEAPPSGSIRGESTRLARGGDAKNKPLQLPK
jgi:hypothetical protein